MKPQSPNPRIVLALVLYLFCFLAEGAAANDRNGSLVGRVLNVDSGEYVYNARVRVRASGSPDTVPWSETYTDQLGSYRLNNVPVGSVVVEAFFTGFPSLSRSVVVGGESDTRVDLELTRRTKEDETIMLSEFKVEASREMTATALAVNSQRFSANTKSVVATDELGFIGDGSIAGAMKFLPGVDLEQDSSGYANGITLSGAPSANVPVTYGGFDLTTSAGASVNSNGVPQRTTQLMQLSLNNISRIEINRSPTPESPGSSLAGSVNFVPKSAFERVRPQYRIEVFGTANQSQFNFGRSAGPHSDYKNQIYPGGTFSAVVPVSKRFGFTLTTSRSVTPKSFDGTFMRWTANYLTASNSYYDTPKNPSHYNLYEYEVSNYSSTYTRNSANLTTDVKLYEGGTLTAAYSHSNNELKNGQRQVRWSTGRGSTDIDRTTSTLTSTVGPSTAVKNNSVLNNTYYLYTEDSNDQGSLRFRHEGKVWRFDLGGSYGEASQSNKDLEKGYLFSSLFNVQNVNLRFDDVQPWSVGSITATRNGAALNPVDLRTFLNTGGYTNTITGTSPTVTVTSSLPPMRTKPVYSSDRRSQINGSAARDFDLSFPLTVKVGFDVSDYDRDQRLDPSLGTGTGFVCNGTDVSLLDFLNSNYDVSLPNGLGVPTSIDNRKLADFFNANRASLLQLNPGEDYRTAVANSKTIKETISAGYIRFDARFFRNRLYAVWGLRYERTEDEGTGPYSDPTLNYVHNAAGQIVDANGNAIKPGGKPALIYTANSLDAVKATWFERKSRAKKSYDNFFPSANLNYDLAENIVARVSYSHTIGRPDLNNIAPGLTLPDLSRVQSGTDTNTYIKVSNPDVEPWTSDNVSLSLEYYSKNLGDITLRGYRRFVSNAFVNQVLPPDTAQAYLDEFGVDSTLYGSSYVSTLVNLPGRVVTSGLELSTRYSLDGLLPSWASGFQVKLSGARSTMTGGGELAAAFGAQNLYLIPWSFGAGITYQRKWFTVSVNGKWNSRQQLAYIQPTADITVDPGTYLYNDATLRVDLDLTVRLTKNISLFVNGRDINGYEQVKLRYSPTTPDIAKNNTRYVFDPVWTIGARASF